MLLIKSCFFSYWKFWLGTLQKWNELWLLFHFKKKPCLCQSSKTSMLSFSRFTPTPACREGKGKGGRVRRREQGDIPQTCQDIPRETIPNISHRDPHYVCAYECMTPVSEANLINWLTSCLQWSRAWSTRDVCVCGKVRVRTSKWE